MIIGYFYIAGEAFSRVRPGFSTPVYFNRESNNVFIQNISDEDVIDSFEPLYRDINPSVSFEFHQTRRRVGNKALYLYHDRSGNAHLKTRYRLQGILLKEFDRLSDRPYLRRTIARFLGDEDRFSVADRVIKKQVMNERKELSLKPLETHNVRNYHDEFILQRQVVRREYKEVREIVAHKESVFVVGDRGSGKTFLLMQLKANLQKQGINPLLLHCGDAHVPHDWEDYRTRHPTDIFRSLLRNAMSKDEGAPRSFESEGFEPPLSVNEIENIKTRHSSIVMLDDFHVLASDKNGWLKFLFELQDKSITFIVSCTRETLAQGYFENTRTRVHYQPKARIVRLSKLNVEEAFRLIESIYANVLSNSEKHDIAQTLSGTSFRLALGILQLINSSFNNHAHKKSDIATEALAEYFDRVFYLGISAPDRGKEQQKKDKIFALLDELVVRSLDPDSFSSEFRVISLEDGINTLTIPSDFGNEIDHLIGLGILQHDLQSFPEFSSKAVMGWWMGKRPKFSKRVGNE